MPEEKFFFLTHTPEQAKKWKDLCASDPERVVRVLRLKYDDPPTSDGDNQRDVFPAIEALREISGGRAPDSPNPLWAPLVDSGVVEALCECIIVLITQLSPLPTLPESLRTKAANDVCFLLLFPTRFLRFWLRKDASNSRLLALMVLCKRLTE